MLYRIIHTHIGLFMEMYTLGLMMSFPQLIAEANFMHIQEEVEQFIEDKIGPIVTKSDVSPSIQAGLLKRKLLQ